jgi:N-methylhydantoinase A/oxoprolinase/acetone carboxylase beta subunit
VLRLGIDTGGTFTDAVLLDEADRLVAKAKALTTKHALVEGVRAAVDAVLAAAPAVPIGLVGLSTTLATNALVERHGAPAGLMMIGFDAAALDRAGLRRALGQDPVALVAGGHDAGGAERAPLDLAAAEAAIRAMAGRVEAIAVTGLFAVRNPAHERRVAEAVTRLTGLPVTCSHELSARLDAPRRALTTLLNARLIGEIHRLVAAVRALLAERSIGAPLMVVKGDGSLVAAETALARPVETILSGPAASVVGAAFLSGARDVVVADIGGTTTDVAFLRGGRPELDPDGARVGGWRTMVEAVRVQSWGLGGDSELRRAPGGHLVLGPRRAVPLSLLGRDHPDIAAVLRGQLERSQARELDGRFAVRVRALGGDPGALSRHRRALWERLGDGPLALEDVVERLHQELPLRWLVDRGLVAIGAFTPSDAVHVLGLWTGWSSDAALLGARLAARFLLGRDDPAALAAATLELAQRRTAEVLVRSALVEDGLGAGETGDGLADALLLRALAPVPDALVQPAVTLGRPVVAIGAPAGLVYPEACRRIGTSAIVPDHAEVANAIGAVVGEVAQVAVVTLTATADERFRVHLPTGPVDHPRLDDALDCAAAAAREAALERARAAGAAVPVVTVARDLVTAADVAGRDLVVEARVTARAVGRPRLGG